MECIRAFNIDYHVLLILKNLFMECDDDQDGIVMRQDLIRLIYERKLMFPLVQLNFFLNVIAVDSSQGTGAYLEKLENMLEFDGSLTKELSLSKLQSI